GQSPVRPGAWVAGENIVSSSVAWSTGIAFVDVVGSPTIALSASPASIDAGQSVNLTIGLGNAPCTLGSGFRCTVAVPLPSGTYQSVCGYAPSNPVGRVAFPSSGDFSLGAGGYLEIYASSNCTAGSLVVTVPISPIVVSVVPAPSVSVAASPASAIDVGQSVT